MTKAKAKKKGHNCYSAGATAKAEIRRVIKVTFPRGCGESKDCVFRRVVRWYEEDGTLIGEDDPWPVGEHDEKEEA